MRHSLLKSFIVEFSSPFPGAYVKPYSVLTSLPSFSIQPPHLPYLGWADTFCELLPSLSNFNALNYIILPGLCCYRKVV